MPAQVVLVVDDDALVRNVVSLLMERDGYLVLSAADGMEALELSRTYDGVINLLITDYQMPQLNGCDLCDRLIQERPGIQTLIMSGTEVSEIVGRNKYMRFLPKPFDGQALRQRVAECFAADPLAYAAK